MQRSLMREAQSLNDPTKKSETHSLLPRRKIVAMHTAVHCLACSRSSPLPAFCGILTWLHVSNLWHLQRCIFNVSGVYFPCHLGRLID